MTKPTARSPYRDVADAERTLSDRVRERVSAAEMQLASSPEVDDTRHTRALWEVFRNIGDARREQRRQTGAPPLPGLRDATRAFRQEPSLAALVAVAAFLDERGLLPQLSA